MPLNCTKFFRVSKSSLPSNFFMISNLEHESTSNVIPFFFVVIPVDSEYSLALYVVLYVFFFFFFPFFQHPSVEMSSFQSTSGVRT
jgi:hypothetical protein